MADMAPLKKLPLDALWRAHAKKFGAFAGYDMPLEFEGLIAEHQWTRTRAGLFDVSHMGPSFLVSSQGARADAFEELASIMERLVSADIKGLAPGQARLTVLLNEAGGVRDDLMITRPVELPGALYIVVNAGTKAQDFALIQEEAGDKAELKRADNRILLALQGPDAESVLAAIEPDAASLSFMTGMRVRHDRFGDLVINRSGYTGEDGYEILVTPEFGDALAAALLADARVKPIGLGARDSLRLEAGLCLYGHELDETISPIEAGLAWTIQKRRREAGDFPGAERILRELKEKPSRKRVGIRPKDRAPAREGVEILAEGRKIGVVTSGGFSPMLSAPISMGYVEIAFANPGTAIELLVRGQPRAAEVVSLPFVPHRYVKK